MTSQEWALPSRPDSPALDVRLRRLAPIVEWGLIVIALVALLLIPDRQIGSDGVGRLGDLTALLRTGVLDDGRYSLIGPLFSAPLWLLGQRVATPQWWLERYNFLVFVFGLAALYLLMRRTVTPTLVRRFLLVLIVASMFAANTLFYYGDMFTAVTVGIGIAAAVFGPTVFGWASIVLGVANTPATLVGMTFAVCRRAVTLRRLRFALALVAAALLIGGEAWLRHGSPFSSDYAGDRGDTTIMPYSGLPGFSYPIFFGLLSILLSFGKGLIFFTSGILLPIRKRLPRLGAAGPQLWTLYMLWLYFAAGLVLVYSRWWAWYGGWFWGPRFFLLVAIPASFAIAVRLSVREASLRQNVFTLVVFALSLWVGINGVVFSLASLDPVCRANHYALEALCLYTPEFSALWHPLVAREPVQAGQVLYAAISLGIGLYLAAPTLLVTAQQLWHVASAFIRTHLPLKTWQL